LLQSRLASADPILCRAASPRRPADHSRLAWRISMWASLYRHRL